MVRIDQFRSIGTNRGFLAALRGPTCRTGPAMLLLAALPVLIVGSPRIARADDGAKLAVVDLQEALSRTSQGERAQKEYEKEVKGLQEDIDEKKEEFERLSKELSKQRNSLSEEALMSKEEKLIELKKDLERSVRDSKEKLRRRNAQLVSGLLEKMREVVQELGKEEGYTLVVEKGAQGVLFVDASVEVTDQVVARFNKRYP